MRLNDIKELTLPKRRDEEFIKVNFGELFSYDFKNTQNYNLDIMGLEVKKDTKEYANSLFEITKSLDKNQVILTINSNIPEPICLIHKIKENETFFTNSLKIEVKENVKASVIEVFTNTSTNSAYCVNRSFEVNENANLEYAKIQDINDLNYLLFNLDVNQKDNSKCKITNFEYGTGVIVNNIVSILDNKNCDYELNGLVKSIDSSSTANVIKTVHNKENSISNINYKHSLKDNSRAVFKALSRVNKDALFSKAFQNSNTILLSNDAAIYAQPHLEILIDELEASHGATTGTLDKDQLLYLQSRGINKNLAYEILLKAFESKIYDNIEDKLIKEFIDSYERKKYV
ncbi:SufD family Fe-S cluster assembly protein [Poseidonibacter ostreae]|jgi:Fe-S cluster assembly protein SufD|uniref:SufD family Fe-S cluster assembly protein n=1 Tax=Poseidonibacter ostreae TaxID=2654171 RepID=A0A6L4WQP0_9BACT|nr:SufD family Fe-S cluster assembly protein [Poseidonibacter ostreae]KAB7885821.1 SufD family Fe-S cluster assembly protein [Poseidonibacter ostreae]KAB7886865.1 SufD family Fe-S cluster assembly protein [Poseidonibacter ostreae]KAB7889930.1 SufD family Fe-S cluster assembly protein [Poseidonibacter ostreae]MAC84211.1 Fe-S assembly protein [Arcobacter sp.]